MNKKPDNSTNGDSSRHLTLEALERGFEVLAAPKNVGTLELIVVRCEDGTRATPEHVVLSPNSGVPGDTWGRNMPLNTGTELTLMRVDVARLFANGQALSLSGDNLLVDLDVSVENLAPGSRLQLGTAVLEVTPDPHTGCAKFKQRFGEAALRLTADSRFAHLRLRGIYAKIISKGKVSIGDEIVVSRSAGSF